LIPSLAALITAAIVILISNTFAEPYQKIMFQFAIFGVGFAVALAMLVSLDDPLVTEQLLALFSGFISLSWKVRYLLTVVMIGSAYFGAGMYIAAPERPAEEAEESAVDYFKTPGSSDNNTGFSIPENVNAPDKEFFEALLDRYSHSYFFLFLTIEN
jgi:hypothetical protein